MNTEIIPNTIGIAEHQQIPTYSKCIIITDIVFCSLRSIMVLIMVLALATIGFDDELFDGELFVIEVLDAIFSLGIVIFGLIGNIMLLSKKPKAFVFCWLSASATIGSIIFSVWGAVVNLNFAQDNPIGSSILYSGILFAILRSIYLVFYIIAINKAKTNLYSHFETNTP